MHEVFCSRKNILLHGTTGYGIVKELLKINTGCNSQALAEMFFGGDPFEHFGGGGGGGGGGGRRGGGGPVDNEGYYKALGVEKDADENAIKKAYKKLALKHHPDRGGDGEVVSIYAFFLMI